MDAIATNIKTTQIESSIGRISKAPQATELNDGLQKNNGYAETAAPLNGSKNNQPLTKENLEETVASLQESLNLIQKQLNFSVSEDSGTFIVEVRNRETQEVIRQIPPDEVLELRERMKELTGLLLDKIV